MAKILVADDEADLEVLIKQKFRQKIREQEYEFVFAVNGTDALEKILQHPDVDIVLSDINMPEMDGVQATEIISNRWPNIKIIMCTVFDDEQNIFENPSVFNKNRSMIAIGG